MNVATVLEMAADGFPSAGAFTCAGRTISYGDLRARVAAAAERLAGTGARHVALAGENSLAVPQACFAAAWAGLVYAPVNPRLPRRALDALFARLEPWTSPLEGTGSGDDRPAEVDTDAEAVRLFTSGTSGAPKQAVLRHRHLMSYLFASAEFGVAEPDEAALVAVPPFHIAGTMSLFSNVFQGRRAVLLESFDAQRWLDAVARERVTHAFVVPTMLARIVAAMHPGDDRVASLRSLSYGGSQMPAPVITRALELFPAGTDFVNAYGLTETSSTVAVLGPQDHRAALVAPDEAGRRRLHSVGRPIPGVEISVRDEAGAPLPAGARGQIWIRGEQVSGEYAGRCAAVADGWLVTGDVGEVDAEGFVFVHGRADDVIVRGGENLSPGEIEDALLRHPGVAEVAVVGVPDDEWGEVVAAMVVPHAPGRLDVHELTAYSRAELGSFKTPSLIVLRDELPYSAAGKLLRRVVGDEVRALVAPGRAGEVAAG
ncbi:AMP-binding protein [Dactylosporangium sp. NPDC000555]|uniref:class I adenylate-forming enzyme family protein n=1 Tax=Dactylosporangium sp. NPDC000555 TaxID=3154260 RepID=UPI0033264662